MKYSRLSSNAVRTWMVAVVLVATTTDESVLAGEKAASKMLTGGVTLSDQLEPLPDALRPGSVFNNGDSAKMDVPNVRSGVLDYAGKPLSTAGTRRAVAGGPGGRVGGGFLVAAAKPPSSHLPPSSTTLQQISRRDATRQMRAYLDQQARLGNSGTIGLKNYLQTNQRVSNSLNATKGGATTRTPQVVPGLKRFRIPAWLAGSWIRTESTEISRVELPTHKKAKAKGKTATRVTDSFGNYSDGAGQSWQVFDPTKTGGSVDRGESIDYHKVSSYDLKIINDEQVVVKLRATHVVVNKASRKIVASYQDEEVNYFNRLDGSRLRTDSSNKVFDFNGKPTLLTTATSFEVRGQ